MESEPKLTKAQRNDLYKAIEEGGLDPAECDDLDEIYEPSKTIKVPIYSFFFRRMQIGEEKLPPLPARQIAQIKHSHSSSIFKITIELWQGRSEVTSAPYYHYESTVEGAQKLSGSGWRGCLNGAHQWAKDVKREYVDPDLWSLLRQRREFFARAQRQDLTNTPFTPSEQAQIAEQIQTIKEYVKSVYSLSVEQAENVRRRFDEAENASQRLGRKDWFLLFAGAVLSLILPAAVPLEAVEHILTMAAQGLGHLFGGEPPPQLPP